MGAAGDSHTTTYGALGALGFGIGTSDIEHYLATQTLVYRRLKTMRVTVDGVLPAGVVATDPVLVGEAHAGIGVHSAASVSAGGAQGAWARRRATASRPFRPEGRLMR